MVSQCSEFEIFQEFESTQDNDCKDNVMDGCCWILLKTINSRKQNKTKKGQVWNSEGMFGAL